MYAKYSIGNFLNYYFDTVMFVLAVTGLTYLATVGDLATLTDSTFYVIAFFLWIIQTSWRVVWPYTQRSLDKNK